MLITRMIALIYMGMLIESPQKRSQFMGLVNNAGVSMENAIKGFTGSSTPNLPPVEVAPDESEFQ